MELTIRGQELRKKYLDNYRKDHKMQLDKKRKIWLDENKDKQREYQVKYWNKKAAEQKCSNE